MIIHTWRAKAASPASRTAEDIPFRVSAGPSGEPAQIDSSTAGEAILARSSFRCKRYESCGKQIGLKAPHNDTLCINVANVTKGRTHMNQHNAAGSPQALHIYRSVQYQKTVTSRWSVGAVYAVTY